MKNTKRVLSILFFAVLGTILAIATGVMPAFGLLLGFASYLPMSMPTGILGENAMTTQGEDKELQLVKKLEEKIKKTVEDHDRGFITDEGLKLKLDPIVAKLDELKSNDFVDKAEVQKLTKAFETLAAEVEANKESGNSEIKGGFQKALKDAYDGMKAKLTNNPDIKDVSMTIKALPITTAAFVGSTNYPMIPQDQEMGVTHAPRTPQTFREDTPTGTFINGDTWTWIEEGTITDNTGTVAENAVFGTVEVVYNNKETKPKKIANYTKVTRESLEDWNEFLNEINLLISKLNNEELNSQLFNGDGTGTNLLGIKLSSVEFSANGIEESNPTIWDVIRLSIAQILINGLTGWMPNKIYMHPADVANQEIEKDTTGNYIFPPFIMPNGMQVKGIPITETTDVSQGFFEVCDINRCQKRFKRELEIRIWEQNEDDAIYDRLTITTSQRVAFRIKDLEKPAFVYDSFDNAISIIGGSTTALNFILAMAPASDASKLTINGLIKAGVTGTDPAKLDDYKVAVAAEASIADLAALQIVIDAA